MATYTKNGHIHGSFNGNRHDKFDGIGRSNAKSFWEEKGWSIGDYDKEPGSVKIKFDHTDQRATKGQSVVFVEAAVKSSYLFKFIRGGNPNNGVDVETRKLKYIKDGDKAVVCMSDEKGGDMLIIPMECLKLAQESCGTEFKGHGDIRTSSDFQMPEHGCHRVRKRCRRGFEQTGEPEDFYRIPYEYVARYRKIDGIYEMIHKPTKKV